MRLIKHFTEVIMKTKTLVVLCSAALLLSLIFAVFSACSKTSNGPAGPIATVCAVAGGNPADDDNDSFSPGVMVAVSFTAKNTALVESISSKFSGSSGVFAMAVYSDSAGAPGSLLENTYTQIPSGTWNTYALENPLTITAGTKYWLAVAADTEGVRATTPSGNSKYVNFTFSGSFPLTQAGWSDTGSAAKIYITACH
jgi:hypothetical protein